MKKSRALFEEVAAPTAAPVAAPGAAERLKARRRQVAAWWFTALAALVAVAIPLFGAVKVVDPAVSAAAWAPQVTVLPPLSPEDWAVAAARHAPGAAPGEGFRTAYWLAWGRQTLGAATAGVWLFGLAGLAAFRALPRGARWAALAPGFVGAAQAGYAWWTVHGDPSAALSPLAAPPVRLAIHLALGCVVLALLLWPAWRLRRTDVALLQARRRRPRVAMGLSGAVVALTIVAAAFGGLAKGAGDAGTAWLYADWPLMAGTLLPPDAFALSPGWRNLVENPALTTFIHRASGYLLALAALAAWLVGRRAGLKGVARWTGVAALAVAAQGALGVGATILWDAPAAALAHLAGAAALVWIALRARFEAAYPAEQSIRG